MFFSITCIYFLEVVVGFLEGEESSLIVRTELISIIKVDRIRD